MHIALVFLNKYSAADVHSIYDVSLLPVRETTENCVITEYWYNELEQKLLHFCKLCTNVISSYILSTVITP